jgi:GNAT superfamily N-acetyltransferase
VRDGHIIIRAAERNDLSDLLSLYNDLSADNNSLERELAESTYDEILSHPGLTILVAEHNGKAVATATLIVVPNLTRGGRSYALIENVVTLKDFRGRGYARSVIQHAIEVAWAKGCYKVMLLTGRTEPAIRRFYEGCGFAQSKTGFQIRRQ